MFDINTIPVSERVHITSRLLKWGIDIDQYTGKIDYIEGTTVPELKCKSIHLIRHAETLAVAKHEFMSDTSDNCGFTEKGIEITKKQFELLKSAVSQLFGKFNTLLKNHAILDDIRGLESQVDTVEEQVYQQIFEKDELALSQKLQAVNFLDIICDISDIIENIADQIQIMLINRVV